VAFLIVPIFGFANAGVSFTGLEPSVLLAPVPLGVAAGLFLGKQAGVFGFAWIAIRMRLANMPRYASWTHLYGVAVLCGIGFTMSLFIGLLAYPESAVAQDETKLGVLLGSMLSGLVGWLILRWSEADFPK
jgi:Na+:H+ antiporter, NhaA family